MKRRFLVMCIFLAAAAAVPGPGRESASAQEVVTLRIATLAPNGSPWMRVFNAWNQSLRQATGDTLRLRFYPGGSQGDERDFIRKMRAGQMDGAAVTGTGLGMIVRPALVLGAPGLFTEYEQIDRVRRRLASDFEEQFVSNGYRLLGWGDVGKLRIFSQAPFARPADLRSRRNWAWRDDIIFTEFLNVIGANPVRLGVPEVYPALQTRMIDTLPSSAVAAVSMQWFTRLSYMSKQNQGILLGATVLSNERYESLSDAHKRALMETSARAHRALSRSVRREDDRAYQSMLQRGMHEVDLSEHAGEWESVAAQTRQRLTGRVWPQSLMQRVMRALNN